MALDAAAIDRRREIVHHSVEKRLHAAGFVTFADLAGSTPEAIVKALKMPGLNEPRVAKENWIGQALERATTPA